MQAVSLPHIDDNGKGAQDKEQTAQDAKRLARELADGLGRFALFEESCVPVREVRVAVTMVGGTSLAVYECGVAQELFRMVHGQGLYGLLKRLTQSHAYIDILSGTSAGGINTICLSAALSNGTDFRPLRETWINLAGIDALLQSPTDRSVTALLRGNGYYLETLTREFERLADPLEVPRWKPGIPSGAPGTEICIDLDLFVTGTYYDGRPRAYFDTRTKPIFTYDYGGIFALKHRAHRGESHFAAGMREPNVTAMRPPSEDAPWPGAPPNDARRRAAVSQRLARVARTTSSLPAIFEPSAVPPDLMNGIIELPRGRESETSFMLDGGFLNNKPVDLVLREIYRRPAEREVLRKVFFVEPQPEALRTSRITKAPNALQNLWFYKDVPGRQSLSAALQSVADHNKRARRVNETLEAVQRMLGSGIRPQAQQHNLWVDVCLRDLRNQLVGLWEQSLGLEGFGGVEKGDGLTEAAERKRRARAEALRWVRTRLFQRMLDSCRDFVNEAKAPEPAHPDAIFKLDDVDTGFLKRKIMNGVDEVYLALYAEASTPEDTQQRRQDARARLEMEGAGVYDAVKQRLRDLYHLRDLGEIVDENLALVAATIAESDEFKIAMNTAASDTPDAESAVDRVWYLLVGCLRQFLRHYDPFDAATSAEMSGFKKDFRKDMGDRSRGICATLRGTPDGEDPAEADDQKIERLRCQRDQRNTWVEKGRKAVRAGTPVLIVEQISRRVDQVVHEAADLLAPVLRELRSRGGSHTGGAPVPLTWALGDNGEMADVSAVSDALRHMDVFLFPVEEAADLKSRYQIELVHISPRDVQTALSEEDPRYKVAGDVLANLGGFFKRSWRANDILWGRLDGAGAIIDTLLDRSRLQRLLQVDGSAWERVLAAIEGYVLRGDAVGPEQPLAPNREAAHAGADPFGRLLLDPYFALREDLRAWLRGARGTAPFVPGADPCLERLRDLLLRRQQYEIVHEEVPIVLAEALAENAVWQGRGDADPLRLRAKATGNGRQEAGANADVDDALQDDTVMAESIALARISGFTGNGAIRDGLQAAARRWASKAFDTAARSTSHFRHRYAVGQETIENDIPPLITIRRVLAGLLVLLHVLDNVMTMDFKASPVGRLLWRLVLGPLSLVTGALHGFVTLLAQNDAAAVAAHAVAWSVILFGTLAGFLGIGGKAVLPFIGIAALGEWTYWWARNSVQRSAASVVWRALTGLVLLGLIGWGAAAVAAWLIPWLSGRRFPFVDTPDARLALSFWPLLVAALALMGVLMVWNRRLKTDHAPQGIVSLELAGSAERTRAILASWDERDRARGAAEAAARTDVTGERPDARAREGETRAIAVTNLLLDYAFVAAYATTLAIACVWASRAPAPVLFWKPAGLVLAGGQWLAGLLDAGENSLLLSQILGRETDRQARWTRRFAVAKFLLVSLGLLYVAVGLVFWWGAR